MKKWIGLAVVFFLILLCGYYGMGIGTERTLKKNIDVLNQSNEITVSLERYQRGWFHSHADLKWIIKVPQSTSDQITRRTVFKTTKNYTFEIPVEIYHGPFTWANSKLLFGLGFAQASAKLPIEYEKKLSEIYNFQPDKFKYSINVLINYLNNTRIELIVPQYVLRAKQGDNFFQWLGMGTSIIVSGDKQRLQGDFYLKGFSWKDQEIKGILGPVKADYDMRQALTNLYTGSAQLKFSSMVIFKQDETLLRISNAQIQSDSDIQNGLFNSTFSSKLNQLMIWNKIYSRNILDLSFKNLDANVLDSMNRKLGELQRSNPNGSDKQKLLWTLIPDLPALLSKGAQMKINNFETNLPNGHIKVDLALNLPNENLTNPLQLVQKIEGESHIRISQTVLSQWVENNMRKLMTAKMQKQALNQEMQASASENGKDQSTQITDPKSSDAAALAATKAKEKIKEWTDAKILVLEGKDYIILLKLMNGKLFINGHVFDPSMLTV